MLNLKNTSSIIRLITVSAANVSCHASWVDLAGTVVTADSVVVAPITTATTTTVVPAPAASTVRNVQALYITNRSTSASTKVTVEHFDGTNAAELMGFILLPGENMTFNEDGRWTHRDQNGAEYPMMGLGAYGGYPVPFMKTGSAADAVGYWYCTAKDAGFPGAWTPGTPGVNGRITDGTTVADNGCIPIKNPAVGANYLTELQMGSSVNQSHLFFDVLWCNSGLAITTTTAQAITTPTLPARDVNGTTSGEGCSIAILCLSAVGLAAVASNATVSYTNSKGVSGKTATLSALVGSQAPATPVIGTMIWFNLAAGDTGVQSIQSITLGTSWVSGTISLMICRDIATMGTNIPNVMSQKVIGSPGIRLYNGSCILHCNLASATTATFYSGELTIMEK